MTTLATTDPPARSTTPTQGRLDLVMGDDAHPFASSQAFGVVRHWVDQVVVVAVSGAVDALTAPQLAAAIDEAITGAPVGVVIDLSRVSFLAAAGLRVLLDAHDEVTPNVGFGVVASGAAARRPIAVLGLDGVLEMWPTAADAVRNLAVRRR